MVSVITLEGVAVEQDLQECPQEVPVLGVVHKHHHEDEELVGPEHMVMLKAENMNLSEYYKM